MKNLVIMLMFVAFSFVTIGCDDPTGQCPQGVCKQTYTNPKASELGEKPPGSEGGEAKEEKK